MKNKILKILIIALTFWSGVSVARTSYDKSSLHLEGGLMVDDAGKPVTGTVQSRYSDGRVLEKLSYVDGKKEGKQRLYGVNGRVMAEVTFVDNLEDGEAKLFYSTGGLLASVIFEKGEPVKGYCIQESGARIDFNKAQLEEFKKTSKMPCKMG